MKIQSIILRQCRVEQITKGRYSSGELDPDLVSIVVEISDGQRAGFGEFIPTSIIYSPGHIGRSDLDEWRVLQQTCARLLGQDARRLRSLLPPELECEGANSLVDGIDFALHDLVGKAQGLPVWALLGGGRPWIWGMPVIFNESVEAIAARCAEFHGRHGYRWFKLKPKCDLEADRETMIRIRERTSAAVQFFIDPNYELSGGVEGVVKYLNALAPHGLMVCEDPVKGDLDTHRQIQARTTVKLMLDEKARTPARVLELVRQQAVAMVNVHANWASGFRGGMRKAELAASGGMGAIIGSVRYLGIGTAAYQTLSSVLPGNEPCEQVNDGEYVKRSVVDHAYEVKDGQIHIPDAPGLGIDVNRDTLEELTLQRVVVG